MDSDPLSKILGQLRFKAGIFVQARYCGRWAVNTSGQRMATFHLIQRGDCWLHLPAADPSRLTPGDLVVFPRDNAHVVSSSAEPVADAEVNMAEPDQAEPDNVLLCGYFEFTSRAAWPLLDALPDAIVLGRDDADGRGDTHRLLGLIAHELDSGFLGVDAIVEHYAHALFVHVLRSAVASGLASGLLTALADARIGRALGALHSQPGADWTLVALAELAAMSRTSFAERFKELVGIAPMRYLLSWRMQIASNLLTTTGLSVADIAERCGYGSEVSFRKAYRKEIGFPPGKVRRQARAAR